MKAGVVRQAGEMPCWDHRVL